MLYDVQQQRRIRNISEGNFHSVSTSNKAEKFRHRRLSSGIENSRQAQNQKFKREENELLKTLDRLNKDKLRSSHIGINVDQRNTPSQRYLPKPPSTNSPHHTTSRQRRFSCPAPSIHVPTINVLVSPSNKENVNANKANDCDDEFSLDIDSPISNLNSVEELALHRTDSVIHVNNDNVNQNKKSLIKSNTRRKSCTPSMTFLPEKLTKNHVEEIATKQAQRRKSTLAIDADELLKRHGGGASTTMLNQGRRGSTIVIEEVTPFYLEKKFKKEDEENNPSAYRRKRRNALSVADVDDIHEFANQHQQSADLNTISFKYQSRDDSPSSPRLPNISHHGLMGSRHRTIDDGSNRRGSFWNQQIKKSREGKDYTPTDELKIDSEIDVADGSQLEFNDDGVVFPAHAPNSDYTLEDYVALRKCRYLRLSKMNWESLKSQSANHIPFDSL